MQALKKDLSAIEVIKSKNFTGGVFDISNDDYHNGPGISRSGIKEFRKSPLHYWHKYLNPNRVKSESTDAMEFGTAFHMFVLEPDLFEETYFVSVKCPHHGSSNLAKEYKANELLKAKGKTIISDVDMARIKAMTDGLYSHPKAHKLLEGTKCEKSIYWIDQESGLLCKARPDAWSHNYVIDIKTTKDGSKRKFSFDFLDGSNHIQAAMIKEGIMQATGIKVELFINLAVEKEPPFAPCHYVISNQFLDLGEQQYKNCLKEIKKCIDSNYWPSYSEDEIEVPNFLISEWQ